MRTKSGWLIAVLGALLALTLVPGTATAAVTRTTPEAGWQRSA